jgi:hypothetical protein
LDAEGEERKNHRSTNQVTVKTAPKRGGLRNIKNKLVQLIHNVVPPYSCFPHDWIALADLYFLKAGISPFRIRPA